MTPAPDAYEVAIHEAGHAVVAYALGEPFVQISTEELKRGSKANLNGHVSFRNWFDPNEPLAADEVERAERFVLIMLAGRYTHCRWRERILDTLPDTDVLARWAHGDEIMIIKLTNSLGRVYGPGSDTHRIRESLRRHLDGLVEQTGASYWQRVEGLADAVIGGLTLSWEDAAGVLQSVEAKHGLSPLLKTWRIPMVRASS